MPRLLVVLLGTSGMTFPESCYRLQERGRFLAVGLEKIHTSTSINLKVKQTLPVAFTNFEAIIVGVISSFQNMSGESEAVKASATVNECTP